MQIFLTKFVYRLLSAFSLTIFLSGCATAANSRVDLASSFLKAATASEEELNHVAAVRAPKTSECEKAQRAHIFVSNLPPVALYVMINRAWMNTLRYLGVTIEDDTNLNNCVRNPYNPQTFGMNPLE